MSLAYLSDKAIKQFIKTALKEDIGDGDHSSLSSVPISTQNRAKLLVKSEGVIAGVVMASKIIQEFDPSLVMKAHMKDGDQMHQGDIAFELSGSARSILTVERLILNCMQRMSGIATYTKHLCSLIKNSKAQILDTRKTTPNFRLAEKWAVSIGGGTNHRFGLYDMIMLKDNHIDFAGSITKAVKSSHQYLKANDKSLPIEVETRNLIEVEEAVAVGGIDVIMLDNMMPSTMKEAIKIIDGRCKTEASGGITEMNITEVAECGVDFISIGALTHSVNSKDLSLKAF